MENYSAINDHVRSSYGYDLNTVFSFDQLRRRGSELQVKYMDSCMLNDMEGQKKVIDEAEKFGNEINKFERKFKVSIPEIRQRCPRSDEIERFRPYWEEAVNNLPEVIRHTACVKVNPIEAKILISSSPTAVPLRGFVPVGEKLLKLSNGWVQAPGVGNTSSSSSDAHRSNNPSMGDFPRIKVIGVSLMGSTERVAQASVIGKAFSSDDDHLIKIPNERKFQSHVPDPDEGGQRSLKASHAVLGAATQLSATAATVLSNGYYSRSKQVLWSTALTGSQLAVIASMGAICLQNKKPKVARIMEIIGTVAVVLSFIVMATTSL